MSLTVESLNRSVISGSTINDIIREHLLVIDKKILNIDKLVGSNEVVYQLPSTFSGVATPLPILKRLVYARIMESLEKRGFTCGLILHSTDTASLVISWQLGIDDREVTRLEAYLKSKIINKQFLQLDSSTNERR